MRPRSSPDRQQIVSKVLVALALAVATVVVYLPVRHHEFVNYDDSLFVTDNPNFRDGLNWQSVRWAFTAGLTHNDPQADYWRPLSYLSHALDIELFGLRAAGHHLMNLGIHVAATVALFLVLQSMTNALWRCAFVAALFALHPLHVESVAWVAERKDVLSGLFFILTLGAYARYARGPFSFPRYLTALLMFALALMSKPMVVTLPFVLLLLDYWPLGRTRWAKSAVGESVEVPVGRLLKEKVPFFVLAATLSVVTYWAQRARGTVETMEHLPPGIRIANALLSYVGYVCKMLWPTGLAVFYPLHSGLPETAVVGAGAALVGMTAAVIWRARHEPWLPAGWFWYLGTLVPVIGLAQVGGQSMADRYTYVPLIGLFIMLSWSVRYRVTERRALRAIAFVAAGAVLGVCAALSRVQVGYWKNSETLFRHALNVTRDNWLAHNNFGITLKQAGRLEDAMAHYEQALRLKPDFAEAHNNLGVALSQAGQVPEAIGHYEQALRLKPAYAQAHYNLGIALVQVGRIREAIEHYEQALRLRPDFAEAHNNLGIALSRAGWVPEAIRHYEQALQFRPDYADAYCNLGVALARLGRVPEAIRHYEQALQFKPDYADAHYNLGVVFWQTGKVPEAIGHYERALQLKPDYLEAHFNLAVALLAVGRAQEAAQHFEQVLQVKPDFAKGHYDLALALEQTGRGREAIGHYEQALKITPDAPDAQNNLAWLLATLAPGEGGNPARAVTLAERACELTSNKMPAYLDTLAAAYAAADRFTDAIATAQKAIGLGRATGPPQVASEIEAHLELYRAGRPCPPSVGRRSSHGP